MEENKKDTEQGIEKPVLEGLRVLGRMIANEMYKNLLTKKSTNDEGQEKDK